MHKLSPEDIQSKCLEKLTFRPLIDCRVSPVVIHNLILMKVLRNLNESAMRQNQRLAGVPVKNGAEFSSRLRAGDYHGRGKYCFLVTGDLGEVLLERWWTSFT